MLVTMFSLACKPEMKHAALCSFTYIKLNINEIGEILLLSMKVEAVQL